MYTSVVSLWMRRFQGESSLFKRRNCALADGSLVIAERTVKTEISVICARKDIHPASMIIASMQKGGQRSLVELRTVTSQGKGKRIAHKIERQVHHVRQHPIELYRMLKTLIHPQSFQCGCQPHVSQIVNFLFMHSSIHRATQSSSWKKRQRLSTQGTNQFS